MRAARGQQASTRLDAPDRLAQPGTARRLTRRRFWPAAVSRGVQWFRDRTVHHRSQGGGDRARDGVSRARRLLAADLALGRPAVGPDGSCRRDTGRRHRGPARPVRLAPRSGRHRTADPPRRRVAQEVPERCIPAPVRPGCGWSHQAQSAIGRAGGRLTFRAFAQLANRNPRLSAFACAQPRDAAVPCGRLQQCDPGGHLATSGHP